VEGKITRLTKFGAFAKLEEDVEGLIHISEISERRIEHPKEALHEGDTVTLRVIKIDPESHRIGLSVRKVESLAYADEDWQTLESMVGGKAPTAEEAPKLLPAEVPATEKPVAEKKHKKEPKQEAVAETPVEPPAETPSEKVIELPATVEDTKPDTSEPNVESPTPDQPSEEAKPE
jgi:predicted RNA-binding protein with RPS1 domain